MNQKKHNQKTLHLAVDMLSNTHTAILINDFCLSKEIYGFKNYTHQSGGFLAKIFFGFNSSSISPFCFLPEIILNKL